MGPSGNVPPGGGPPGNNPTGMEYAIENENSRNREQNSDRRLNRRRGLEGPEFRYIDPRTHKYVYPEAYHEKEPIYLAKKQLVFIYMGVYHIHMYVIVLMRRIVIVK